MNATSQSWTSHPHPSMSSSRNCPMFKIVGVGGQIKGLEVSTVQHHMASSLHASACMAASLLSVRGQMSGHHSISFSLTPCLHSSSHHLILHRGSTFLTNRVNTSWQGDAVVTCLAPLYFTLVEWVVSLFFNVAV